MPTPRSGAGKNRPRASKPTPSKVRPTAIAAAPGKRHSRSAIWGGCLAAVIAVGIVGYAVCNTYEQGLSWQQRADKISGIVDYRRSDPSIDASPDEGVTGTVSYATTPPAYGYGNPNWQRCDGDVYDEQISNENAVHSLEQGAVWITYDPAKVTTAQVDRLATTYVDGNDFTLLSPYPGQPSAVSLQAWGFQLQLSTPTDPRIKQFVQDLRKNTSLEPDADCASGDYITATGTDPHNPNGADIPPSTAPSGTPTTPAD